MKRTSGKVFLVGAGPGDPGLLTLKGRKCLKTADVVITDALVNPEILRWARPRALKIPARLRLPGKSRTAVRRAQQDRINRLMVRYARMGRNVVRLKGGDPFLFGRGGEEAEVLASSDIPFEVVPGVSSVTAVPAYAGIPVTDRRFNSILTVLTGHSVEPAGSPNLPWKEVPRTGTIVILMGAERMGHILRGLIRRGWPESTPCAFVRRGTCADQEASSGTLAGFMDLVKDRPGIFRPPGITIVGDVVKLRGKLDWLQKNRSKARS